MNCWQRLLRRGFAVLLRLYPPRFRAAFGVEMQAVFGYGLQSAASQGNSALLALVFREAISFPGCLLRQHWEELFGQEEPMKTSLSHAEPGSWGAALLAGLPHLLMGLLVGLGNLTHLTGSSPSVSIILGILLVALVVGLLIYAWQRGWPLWSASWYIYGAWVALAILFLGIEILNLDVPWRYINALFFAWVLFCIAGYFGILLKSNLHGLLSVVALFPMLGVGMLEFIPNDVEGWTVLGVGLLVGATAAAIVRMGSFPLGLGLTIAANLLAGLILAYMSEYQSTVRPPGLPDVYPPQLGNFLSLLALYIAMALGIIGLPLVLRGAWNWGRRRLQM